MARPKLWYLRRLRVHQRLPDAVSRALELHARVERWGHQADIFRDPKDLGVSIVLKGKVCLKDADCATEFRLRRGDVFGRAETKADVAALNLRAHDDTLLAVLSREEFSQMIVPHLGRMSSQVGWFRNRQDLWVPVQPLLFTTPKERLAKVLLHLVETEGGIDDNGGGWLEFRLQPHVLASLSGGDIGRVRQILTTGEATDILERSRVQARIPQLKALRRIACEG